MKIKSCPFCGDNDLDVGHSNKDHEGIPVYIVCGNCGAQGPMIYVKELTDSVEYIGMLSNWNFRVSN